MNSRFISRKWFNLDRKIAFFFPHP
ncbi:tryptophanase leader peptide [Aeromonas diversa]